MIIDLKSGGASTQHRDDLRFYALLETIRIGVPPRLVASYYLDQGLAHAESVTEGMLDATLARTVDGARTSRRSPQRHGRTRETSRHVVPLVPDPRRLRRGQGPPASRRQLRRRLKPDPA